MEKQHVLSALKKVREQAKKRKFTQRVDFIINLLGIDLKKDAEKINTFVTLPHTLGKPLRITGLIGPALSTKAKNTCNHVILADEFKTIDAKKVKKIASETDFFIAQADIMPKVAGAFGKILGPRGLMPSPKAGCVVPPTADLKEVVDRLSKTVRVQPKNEPIIKICVGTETMKDEEITDNILSVYNTVLHSLPQEKNNIKNSIIKLTMGSPVVIGEEDKKKKETQKTSKKTVGVKNE